MPRIKNTPGQLADKAVVMVLDDNMVLFDKNDKDMARLLGVSVGTFYNRRKKPSLMRLSELRVLCQRGKVSVEDLCDIVGMPKTRRNEKC